MKPEPQIYYDCHDIDKYIRTRFSPKLLEHYRDWVAKKGLNNGELFVIYADEEIDSPYVKSICEFLITNLGDNLHIHKWW